MSRRGMVSQQALRCVCYCARYQEEPVSAAQDGLLLLKAVLSGAKHHNPQPFAKRRCSVQVDCVYSVP